MITTIEKDICTGWGSGGKREHSQCWHCLCYDHEHKVFWPLSSRFSRVCLMLPIWWKKYKYFEFWKLNDVFFHKNYLLPSRDILNICYTLHSSLQWLLIIISFNPSFTESYVPDSRRKQKKWDQVLTSSRPLVTTEAVVLLGISLNMKAEEGTKKGEVKEGKGGSALLQGTVGPGYAGSSS